MKMNKSAVAFLLGVSMVAGSVAPAFAQTSGGGLGSILGAISNLIGSTAVNSQSAAQVSVGGATVTATGANTTNQSGVTGLLSGVLGGTSGTSAAVSYDGYSASTSDSGSWGLASSVQSLSGLLAGLGSILGGATNP